jgi:hypothetical protein
MNLITKIPYLMHASTEDEVVTELKRQTPAWEFKRDRLLGKVKNGRNGRRATSFTNYVKRPAHPNTIKAMEAFNAKTKKAEEEKRAEEQGE